MSPPEKREPAGRPAGSVLSKLFARGILDLLLMGDDDMQQFLVKLFAPWKAEACFDDLDAFYAFLLRRNKALNAVRVFFFLIAAVCLMLGYAFEPKPYNDCAVAALVLALGLSLAILQNEKQLPDDLREQK